MSAPEASEDADLPLPASNHGDEGVQEGVQISEDYETLIEDQPSDSEEEVW
jgi:hypothetical protein